MSITISFKKVFVLFIVFIATAPVSLFAQKQILQLDTARNYRSESYLRGGYQIPDPNPVLVYNVMYDVPDHFDEEFTHAFTIEMVDTTALKQGKAFNVAIDTNVVKCQYMIRNHVNLLTRIYQPERFPTTMIGTIKVLNWTNDAIEFEFDIAVKEGTRKGFLFYQGNKKLSRSTLNLPDYIEKEMNKKSK